MRIDTATTSIATSTNIHDDNTTTANNNNNNLELTQYGNPNHWKQQPQQNTSSLQDHQQLDWIGLDYGET